MDTEWVRPEIVELTIEDASELTNIDLACAGTGPATQGNDHG
jgi:hypothetical protein